jgi:hypothetical protein
MEGTDNRWPWVCDRRVYAGYAIGESLGCDRRATGYLCDRRVYDGAAAHCAWSTNILHDKEGGSRSRPPTNAAGCVCAAQVLAQDQLGPPWDSI